MNQKYHRTKTPLYPLLYPFQPVPPPLFPSLRVYSASINSQLHSYRVKISKQKVILIQGLIKAPNNIDKFIDTVRVLLNNNPFLVKLHNNMGESAYDYAYEWSKISRGRQIVIMNGKPRRYHSMQMNRQIWKDIVSILDNYRAEARFRMFNHFMEKDTTNIIEDI